MRNIKFWVLARLSAILLACCAMVLAQSERGAIRGTVEDPSGAVVSGATVTATNVGTSIPSSTTTSSAGNYNIPQLTPGAYYG